MPDDMSWNFDRSIRQDTKVHCVMFRVYTYFGGPNLARTSRKAVDVLLPALPRWETQVVEGSWCLELCNAAEPCLRSAFSGAVHLQHVKDTECHCCKRQPCCCKPCFCKPCRRPAHRLAILLGCHRSDFRHALLCVLCCPGERHIDHPRLPERNAALPGKFNECVDMPIVARFPQQCGAVVKLNSSMGPCVIETALDPCMDSTSECSQVGRCRHSAGTKRCHLHKGTSHNIVTNSLVQGRVTTVDDSQ